MCCTHYEVMAYHSFNMLTHCDIDLECYCTHDHGSLLAQTFAGDVCLCLFWHMRYNSTAVSCSSVKQQQTSTDVQLRHQGKTMHVLILLVSSKSSSKCWLDSAAIYEAGGRHGHCDGPCQVASLMAHRCQHATMLRQIRILRELDTLTET